MRYYIIKRYFFTVDNDGTCGPVWLKAPHWNPISYATWQEAREAYILLRLWRYPSVDLDITVEKAHS